MNTWNRDDTEQVLKLRLEEERATGIPHIPDSLKPENLEALLKQKERGQKRYRRPGSIPVIAATAVLLLIILPVAGVRGQKEATSNQAAPSATMSAVSNSLTDSGNFGEMEENRMESAMEAGTALDAVCGGTAEETAAVKESEKERLIQADGSYEAAYIEDDMLYLLQKTERHELYIICLSEAENWQKVFPELPPEEEILKMEKRERELIFHSQSGICYRWPLEN